MKTIDFWFDPISPYAWLAFDALPDALEGVSCQVNYRPLLFAGLLSHWGQKGPAEIEPKRQWTYQDVVWRGHRQGLRLMLPAQHPFNPLPLLRLALACVAEGGLPNRYVVEALFRHVWEGGADPLAADRLAALRERLQPLRDPADPMVKLELKSATDAAVKQGLFGVPTMVVDGQRFWGADALPMLKAYLIGDPWFEGPTWADTHQVRPGVSRR